MARPRKNDNMTYMLRIRMSQADRELMEQAAKVKSLQLSSWARSELVALARSILGANAVGSRTQRHEPPASDTTPTDS